MNRGHLLVAHLGVALLTFIDSVPVLASTPAPPSALTTARRAAVADSIAGLLAARYPEAALGLQLADSLRTWARADVWRQDADPKSFAASLQRDMQRVLPDPHLWTRYEPNVEYVRGPQMRRMVPGAAAPPGGGGGGMVRRTFRIDSRDSLEIARTNFGFTRAEMLDGGIGYLKVDRFVPRDLAEPTAVASMAKIQSARAVVVDLRENPGGSPDMVAFVMSYFLGEDPQLIHASYWRAMGVADSLWSVRSLPGARLTGRRVYVLTSARTGSAAEMFAYGAKRLGIATVVGETTAGAGQGGMTYSVGEGITFFSPERRVLTGPGWEGVGVEPDVRVAADDALHRAQVLALDSSKSGH